MSNNRYLITGGPGTGKTTIVNYLGTKGYKTSSEVAYRIVEKNLATGNNNLPWGNRIAFDSEVLVSMLNDYLREDRQAPIFYDGGILDILAWEAALGYNYSNFTKFVDKFRYETAVFIPEPWEEIYERNPIRNFSFNDSVKIHDSVKLFYKKYRYELIDLPKGTTIADRSKAILSHIN